MHLMAVVRMVGPAASSVHPCCSLLLGARNCCMVVLFGSSSSSLRLLPPRRPLCSIVQGAENARRVLNGPGMQELTRQGKVVAATSNVALAPASQVPYLEEETTSTNSSAGKLYLETYGCQMNFNDLEVVLAIMKKAGYGEIVQQPEDSDVILINTCAIRENAENKIWQRLNFFKHIKSNWKRNAASRSDKTRMPPKVAVLGCMAERLKEKLIEADKMVDVVCGPDAYRDLPRLLASVEQGQAAVNTLLSLEETYADVSPVRISKDSVTAFVSVMRGCNNMCSFCIVPFTRGRERSRPVDSIVREVGELWEQGVKEVTLLGQNVNSYADMSGNQSQDAAADKAAETPLKKEEPVVVGQGKLAVKYFKSDVLSPGFSAIYRVKESGLRFAHLLDRLADCYPEMRFRFTSPHPKDFPDDLLYVMRDHPNICKSIHLPAQSGSSRVLERMKRGYTREAYLLLVERIRSVLPDVGFSSDFMAGCFFISSVCDVHSSIDTEINLKWVPAGFCGETEDDHLETLSLIESVGYEMAYMFAYSMREKTHAHRHDVDDVPEEVKQRRLSELIATFRRTTVSKYEAQLGKTQLVLIEAPNRRDPEREWGGRNDRGQKVYVANTPVPDEESGTLCAPKPGDYVAVRILDTTFASLRGEPLLRTSLRTFYR